MKLFGLTGPSGGGKDYLKRAALARFPFMRELVWVTTRPLRPGETAGGNRKHVSLAEFHRLGSNGSLWLVQELYGNFYGLEIDRSLRERPESGAFLTEFHVDNLPRARIELPVQPLTIGLFLSDAGFIRHRLMKRGTESPEEIERRVSAGVRECEKMAAMRSSFSLALDVTPENESTIHAPFLEFLEQRISLP